MRDWNEWSLAFRDTEVLLLLFRIIGFYSTMQDYTNSVKDILVELSNTLIHLLKKLMEIQSLVIQNKPFLQSDVSRIIYGIFSCSCSQWLSFWTSFLARKPMFMQRNVEIICLWRYSWLLTLWVSLSQQFGLYGYIGIIGKCLLMDTEVVEWM